MDHGLFKLDSADEIDLFEEPISISEEDIELIKQLKVTQNKHD